MKAELTLVWQIVRLDLLLFWRLINQGATSQVRSWATIGVLFALFQVPAIFFSYTLKSPPPPGILSVAWLLIGLMMGMGSAERTVLLLYQRSDLDLLLSSPVPARVVLLGRLLSIAASLFLGTALFVLPALDAAVIRFGPAYLASFVVWALLATIVSAIGASATLGLVRLMGVRRARFATQMLAVLCLSTPGLIALMPKFLEGSTGKHLLEVAALAVKNPIFASLGRASQGSLAELAGLALLATALAFVATKWLGRTFATGAQDVSLPADASLPAPAHVWTDNLVRVVMRKEVRLMVRHPLVYTSVLPMVLMIGLLLVVQVLQGNPRLAAPISIYWSGMVTLALAGLAATAEVGWDLIRQGMVPEKLIWRLKLATCLGLSLSPLVPLWIWQAAGGRPGLALLSLLVALSVGVSSTWLGLTTTEASPRQDLLPQAKGKGLHLKLAAATLCLVGAVGVGLFAFDYVGLGLFFTAATLLGMVASLTLVEPLTAESP